MYRYLELTFFVNEIFYIKSSPPRHAPIAKAHTRGCNGKFKSSFSDSEITILIIIVVKGMLSTKADAIAETCQILIVILILEENF